MPKLPVVLVVSFRIVDSILFEFSNFRNLEESTSRRQILRNRVFLWILAKALAQNRCVLKESKRVFWEPKQAASGNWQNHNWKSKFIETKSSKWQRCKRDSPSQRNVNSTVGYEMQ